MKAPLFYSKILLFGEYGIIKNSKGLSIPYNSFKGGLKIGDINSKIVDQSNRNLQLFRDFLSDIDSSIVAFDLKKMNNDLSSFYISNSKIDFIIFFKNLTNIIMLYFIL